MRVLLSTYGSRGDVEPMAALGVALQALGAEVLVCAPPDQEFVDLLARAGLPHAPAFAPVRAWVTEAMKNRAAVDLPRLAAEIVIAQFDAISAAAEGCDAIVATGLFPSTAAARTVAEARGLPYACAAYCPLFLPSPDQKPYEYLARPHPKDVTDNRALWALDVETKNLLFGGGINAQRASIGLPPAANVRDFVMTDRPWLASDPTLSPWRATDMCGAVQTGAWILPDDRPLPADLAAFLAAGAPPVYVGFGSMSVETAKDAARVAVETARALERRVVLLRGWAELAANDDRDDCLVVGDVNQQALFARVAAVVHHGGAGTTTAATRAGAPQVVVPQIVDQPYWAGRVADLGVGVAHDGPAPNFASMTAALGVALSAEIRVRASAVAGMIRPDGAVVAARLALEMIGREALRRPA